MSDIKIDWSDITIDWSDITIDWSKFVTTLNSDPEYQQIHQELLEKYKNKLHTNNFISLFVKSLELQMSNQLKLVKNNK